LNKKSSSFDLDSYCLELANENKNLKEKLYIDELTGLLNILSYNKDIKNLSHPKVVVVDIDAFSEINEYFGRDAGDNVLKEIAQVIDNYASNENMKAYRIGSDQFMLLESGLLDMEKYERISQELVCLLKTREIHILGFDDSVVYDSTIGFCLEEDETLNKALVALSHAKKTQKDYACYFYGMGARGSYKDKIKCTKLLKKAKRLGVKIAIDDLGTEYGNFSYLMEIKPDYLKIDGSIIKNIDKDENSEAIIKAIISFATTLQIKTIAEFVHTKEVYDACYNLGIDEFQGFIYQSLKKRW